MLDILGYSYDWAYSGNEAACAKLVEGKNKKHLFDCVLVDVTIQEIYEWVNNLQNENNTATYKISS